MNLLIILLFLSAVIITWLLVFLIARFFTIRARAQKKLLPKGFLEDDYRKPDFDSVPLPPRLSSLRPRNQQGNRTSSERDWGREHINLQARCPRSGRSIALCDCSVCLDLKRRS